MFHALGVVGRLRDAETKADYERQLRENKRLERMRRLREAELEKARREAEITARKKLEDSKEPRGDVDDDSESESSSEEEELVEIQGEMTRTLKTGQKPGKPALSAEIKAAVVSVLPDPGSKGKVTEDPTVFRRTSLPRMALRQHVKRMGDEAERLKELQRRRDPLDMETRRPVPVTVSHEAIAHWHLLHQRQRRVVSHLRRKVELEEAQAAAFAFGRVVSGKKNAKRRLPDRDLFDPEDLDEEEELAMAMANMTGRHGQHQHYYHPKHDHLRTRKALAHHGVVASSPATTTEKQPHHLLEPHLAEQRRFEAEEAARSKRQALLEADHAKKLARAKAAGGRRRVTHDHNGHWNLMHERQNPVRRRRERVAAEDEMAAPSEGEEDFSSSQPDGELAAGQASGLREVRQAGDRKLGRRPQTAGGAVGGGKPRGGANVFDAAKERSLRLLANVNAATGMKSQVNKQTAKRSAINPDIESSALPDLDDNTDHEKKRSKIVTDGCTARYDDEGHWDLIHERQGAHISRNSSAGATKALAQLEILASDSDSDGLSSSLLDLDDNADHAATDWRTERHDDEGHWDLIHERQQGARLKAGRSYDNVGVRENCGSENESCGPNHIHTCAAKPETCRRRNSISKAGRSHDNVGIRENCGAENESRGPNHVHTSSGKPETGRGRNSTIFGNAGQSSDDAGPAKTAEAKTRAAGPTTPTPVPPSQKPVAGATASAKPAEAAKTPASAKAVEPKAIATGASAPKRVSPGQKPVASTTQSKPAEATTTSEAAKTAEPKTKAAGPTTPTPVPPSQKPIAGATASAKPAEAAKTPASAKAGEPKAKASGVSAPKPVSPGQKPVASQSKSDKQFASAAEPKTKAATPAAPKPVPPSPKPKPGTAPATQATTTSASAKAVEPKAKVAVGPAPDERTQSVINGEGTREGAEQKLLYYHEGDDDEDFCGDHLYRDDLNELQSSDSAREGDAKEDEPVTAKPKAGAAGRNKFLFYNDRMLQDASTASAVAEGYPPGPLFAPEGDSHQTSKSSNAAAEGQEEVGIKEKKSKRKSRRNKAEPKEEPGFFAGLAQTFDGLFFGEQDVSRSPRFAYRVVPTNEDDGVALLRIPRLWLPSERRNMSAAELAELRKAHRQAQGLHSDDEQHNEVKQVEDVHEGNKTSQISGGDGAPQAARVKRPARARAKRGWDSSFTGEKSLQEPVPGIWGTRKDDDAQPQSQNGNGVERVDYAGRVEGGFAKEEDIERIERKSIAAIERLLGEAREEMEMKRAEKRQSVRDRIAKRQSEGRVFEQRLRQRETAAEVRRRSAGGAYKKDAETAGRRGPAKKNNPFSGAPSSSSQYPARGGVKRVGFREGWEDVEAVTASSKSSPPAPATSGRSEVKTRALKAATKVPAEADAPARESAAAAAGVGDRKTEALRISGGDEGPPKSLQELRDRVRNIMQQREKERSHRREQLHADMIRKIAAQEEIRQKKEEAVAAARRKAAEIAEREEQERLLRAARGNRGLSGDPGSGGAPPANARDRHATAHHQIAHALQVAERAFSEEFSLLWDLAAKRVEDEEKLKKILSAAIFVQSRWRGFKTRQGLLLRARAPEDIAARKIQSRWQGRMQRFRSRVRAACVRWDKDSGVTSPAAGSGFGGGGEGQRLAARRLRAPNYRRQLGLVESLFPYDEESVGGPIRTILREMDSELRPKFFERYAQVCEKETLEREIDKLLGDLLQSVSRRRADLLEDKTADAVCASGCSSGQSSAAAHYSRAGEDAASTRAAWEREFELETLTTLRSALLVQRMQHRKEIAKNVAHVADGDGDPQERNTSVLRPTMELLRRKYSELMQAETSALKTVVDETRRKLHAAERAANGEGEHYEKSLARVQGDLARKKEKLRLTSSAFAHEKGVV
eukprot:g13507.t1